MLVRDESDRRMSIRWRPPATTRAEIAAEQCSWTGTVLNLSQDGAEIDGLPPGIWNSVPDVTIRIDFQGYAVEWAGSLQRLKPHSHVVVFGNSPLLREEQYVCAQCGDKIRTYRHRSRADREFLVCTVCEVPDIHPGAHVQRGGTL